MRTYPRNSPPAAARIVALAVLADGHLAKTELDALERHGAHPRLGLAPEQLHGVFHAFCEDLLSTSDRYWGAACHVDRDTLAVLLDEVDDPRLQTTILELCVAAVEADGHVADAEALVLAAAREHWRQPDAADQPQHDERGLANA